MESGYQLTDLFDLEEFQKLQDAFATAFDMGFITVDYTGNPAFKYSGFTEFCQLLRKKEGCLELCRQCDAHGGIHATITGKPYIYQCHAGLVDFAVPLILEGKYIGSVLGGQVQVIGPAPEIKPIIPQQYDWESDPKLVDALTRVHKVPYKKLVASVNLLQDIMQSMIKEEFHKIQQSELDSIKKEHRKEKKLRISLEERIESSTGTGNNPYQSNDFLFYVLNIVSRMAFLENAEETELATYNTALIMRYANESKRSDLVTLGEEIECVNAYLEIEKLRLGQRLKYNIQIPEEYYGVLCPFMSLMPFVENSIKHAVNLSDTESEINISGQVEASYLLIKIEDNGRGMNSGLIARLLELEDKKTGKLSGITRINRKAKDYFGDSCAISILSEGNGFFGTQVQLKFPINYK